MTRVTMPFSRLPFSWRILAAAGACAATCSGAVPHAFSHESAEAMGNPTRSIRCPTFVVARGPFQASFSKISATRVGCREVHAVLRHPRGRWRGWSCVERIVRGVRRGACQRGPSRFRYVVDSSGP